MARGEMSCLFRAKLSSAVDAFRCGLENIVG